MNEQLSATRERRIHQAFTIGVFLKGLNAFVEILLGIGLLLPIADSIAGLVSQLAQQELIEDPNDFLAVHFQNFSSLFSQQAELYGSLYLLSHGIVKMVLVWGLLRDKLWAYPASLAVLTLFVLYQVIKILQNHSIPLVLLTIFDLIIMWLVYHEYRQHTAAKPLV